jgi:hypothetical protein
MNNETDVRQVMERTTTEDSAKIQEPERATGDGDAIDAEVLSLRSQLSTLTQERDALRGALQGLRALILAEFPGAYDCIDGYRADRALAIVDQGASK